MGRRPQIPLRQSYFEWFGKRPEEVLGTHYRVLVDEQFYTANEPYVRRALAGERISYERSLTAADGKLRHLFVNYIPDFYDAGSVVGFFVQVNDVIQIKHTEAELEIGAAVFKTPRRALWLPTRSERFYR